MGYSPWDGNESGATEGLSTYAQHGTEVSSRTRPLSCFCLKVTTCVLIFDFYSLCDYP